MPILNLDLKSLPKTIGIFCSDLSGGIGINSGNEKDFFEGDFKIPWSGESFASIDRAIFKEVTMGRTCILGRKTNESLYEFLPNGKLEGRSKIVLSNQIGIYATEDGGYSTSYCSTKKYALDTAGDAKIAIIGGGSIYALFEDDVEAWIATILNADYNCNVKIDEKILNKVKTGQVIYENSNFKTLLWKK